MNYQLYQAYADLSDPSRTVARALAKLLGQSALGTPLNSALRPASAAMDVFACTRITHQAPAFGIKNVHGSGLPQAVNEAVVYATPFCSLVHFAKPSDGLQPRVLVVAPMSGHFATLLRGTVRTLLRDHDVYITHWHNARDVPLTAGPFGLDDYIGHIRLFLTFLGGGAHVVAVCQPTVPALAAIALMAADEDEAQPASMTLIAGPIDTRVNPTAVNQLAESRPIEWFERNLIGYVPLRYKGALRAVYPGFLQLAAFMGMNPERHVASFSALYQHLVSGEDDEAQALRIFYSEYFSMADLPAEFYLETVARIFQQQLLARGELEYRGTRVNPGRIRRTALLTIEGEKDDISAVGQTLAAHDLCSAIRPYRKRHYVQTGAGHYGVFNGRRWNNEIYPLVRDFIYSSP